MGELSHEAISRLAQLEGEALSSNCCPWNRANASRIPLGARSAGRQETLSCFFRVWQPCTRAGVVSLSREEARSSSHGACQEASAEAKLEASTVSRGSVLGLEATRKNARAHRHLPVAVSGRARPTAWGTHARGIGVNRNTLPGAYVAVQGPWRYRWVRIGNPPPGTPAYVRQRYRTVRYVAP